MLALKQEARATVRWDDFFIDVPGDFRCESGDALSDPHVRVRVFGDLRRPVVVVAGGISSGRCLDEWWSDQVAEGAAIDLTRYCAIGFDFSPTEDRRVRLSPLDQAQLVAIALDSLGVEHVFAWVGASYGAMVGLAFAAEAPARLERLCAISTAHKPAALARGWRGVQRRMVEFAIASTSIRRAFAQASRSRRARRTRSRRSSRSKSCPGACPICAGCTSCRRSMGTTHS
ncbi:MAG: alpha/beta fold hydrolase [Caulobacteraceae bacterium]|nr:alpha/beta fold hydrolase [Caulobacteraceae bacterium]